ncbi:MAG: ElyC/SanA/YdcF family protein [Candidatus Omnitrophota bacterium]
MIKNENIVCISSIDWDFIWQGHQEIMDAFAKNGNRVLFIENTGVRSPGIKDIPRLRKRLVSWIKSAKGFREERENLFVYSPLVLPFPYSRLARFINKYTLLRSLKRWLKVMGFRDPIIWTFLPTGTAVDIAGNIDGKLLIYYCIADFYKLVDNSAKVKRTEDELIKRCDLVFAQGDLLKERCRRLNKNVHKFPFGVNIEAFESYDRLNGKLPKELEGIRGPVVGYVGGLHRHVDFELIRFISDKHPDWSIVMIGPVQADISEIDKRKNILLLGKKDFNDLPAYINRFDACMIPYIINDYTMTVFPTKLNEYHAMGKPVVSTSLPEVIDFNKKNNALIAVAAAREDFDSKLAAAVADKSGGLADMRIKSAKNNSWTERIEEMSRLIQSTMERKAVSPPHWRESFLQLYKTARVRMIKILAAAITVYGLIFYTPIIWYAAKPLLISQTPVKADCIVVYGGGVGESGKAGQGYEERVQRAVELYKSEYAGKMIFLSGYAYLFKEPLVMKALAISLGVPEKDIILEDMAKNTFENVEFTRRIVQKHGWRHILLVSSPYHMGRVSLVFRKIAGDIDVTYTPIVNGHFYARTPGNLGSRWKRINIEQIRGILHEYIGILYYWFKGYI